MSRPNEDLKFLIESRINKEGEGGCWNWVGAKGGSGIKYGIFRSKGNKVYAHRAAYAEYVGAIPDGHEVCHRCDNPSCVNPEHLFIGSHKENMADMARKSRVPHAVPSDTKRQIRHLYFAERRGQSEIARHFGLRQSTVHGIISQIQEAPKPN